MKIPRINRRFAPAVTTFALAAPFAASVHGEDTARLAVQRRRVGFVF